MSESGPFRLRKEVLGDEQEALQAEEQPAGLPHPILFTTGTKSGKGAPECRKKNLPLLRVWRNRLTPLWGGGGQVGKALRAVLRLRCPGTFRGFCASSPFVKGEYPSPPALNNPTYPDRRQSEPGHVGRRGRSKNLEMGGIKQP